MNLNTTAAGIHAPSIKFSPTLEGEAKEIFVIGRKASLTVSNIVSVTSNDEKVIGALLNSIKDSGSATTFLSDGRKLAVIMLPAVEKICRNNHFFSPHTITATLDNLGLATSARQHCCQIVVMDSQIEDFACPAAAALARSMPLYHSKSDLEDIAASSGVSVSFHDENTAVLDPESSLWQTAAAVCEGIRLAAQLGDMPPAELSPDTYAHKCHEIASGLGVTCSEIKGDDLRTQGYGGIMGVGMAARCPPRMVIMTYSPENSTEHIAMCGKGVVYDTGGLALKSKTGMCEMKHDCGGSAVSRLKVLIILLLRSNTHSSLYTFRFRVCLVVSWLLLH